MRDLGLDPAVERYHLGFVGCAAAMPALRLAARLTAAQPAAVVLVVCLELCTLHIRPSSDPQQIVAASVFADGAAAAIVTADPRKARGDFRAVRGNFGAGGGKVDLDGVQVHPGIDALLADPAIDLVDICLPSYLHAPVAIRALEAGKHVLVEKPVALTVAPTRRH